MDTISPGATAPGAKLAALTTSAAENAGTPAAALAAHRHRARGIDIRWNIRLVVAI
jgi:hypothetical protein